MGDQYSDLGYITNYLQNMTSPAHVVPVYFTRWWRLSFSDRFEVIRSTKKQSRNR